MGLLNFVKRMKGSIENRTDPLGEKRHILDDQLDLLYYRAIDVVLETQQASISMLQRKLDIGYRDAAELMDRMENEGIVSPFAGSTPRKILVSSHPMGKIVREKAQTTIPVPNISIRAIDNMEGHEFEHWCSDLLKQNGFSDVEVTKGSGDQGVDILATKSSIRYAIQCKCYSSSLGNKPVQEVYAGKSVYKCHVGVVMTNSHFTSGAKELAEATGILLWDRDVLQDMVSEAAKLGKEI